MSRPECRKWPSYPDREKLAKYAVSVSTVTNVINSLFGGAILTGQTEYQKGRHRYEIELRLSFAVNETKFPISIEVKLTK